MVKFTRYVLVMSGLILLFYFGGLLQQTPSSTFLNLILNPSSFQETPLALKAVLAIEGILASAIIVGFGIGGNLELGVMVSFSVFIFNSLWDFISVYQLVAAVNPVIAILLFSPALFLFVITMLEWWRGVTT